MEDDLPGYVKLGRPDYHWAASVVATYAWHFAEDFPVLVEWPTSRISHDLPIISRDLP